MYKILFLLILAVQSQGQGIIFFEGTWEEALSEAKKSDKAIFVDSYTTWCGPCKVMAKNTFTDSEVGDFFNQNFINVKFDMEKEEGVKFGHTYPVSAYPTLYFINQDGEVLKKVVGGQKPDGLIAQGKAALKSNDRSPQYEELYNEGNRDYTLVFNYIKALNDVGKPSLKISNEYLNSNPNITDDQRLLLVFEAAVEADSKLFEEVVQSKNKLIDLVGEEKYNAKVYGACNKTFEKALEYEYEELMHEAIEKAEITMNEDDFVDFNYKAKMKYYESFDQNEKYFDAAEDYIKKGGKKNAEVLSYVAMDICTNINDDEKILKKAFKWAKKAYDLDASENNFFVLCNAMMANKMYQKVIDLVDKVSESPDITFNKGMLYQLKRNAENLNLNQG